MSAVATSAGVRLDIWMWRARFFRTRSVSASEIAARGVRLSRAGLVRRVTRPATTVMVGDIVTFGSAVHIRSVEVLALGVRRGPAPEAAGLFRDVAQED